MAKKMMTIGDAGLCAHLWLLQLVRGRVDNAQEQQLDDPGEDVPPWAIGHSHLMLGLSELMMMEQQLDNPGAKKMFHLGHYHPVLGLSELYKQDLQSTGWQS